MKKTCLIAFAALALVLVAVTPATAAHVNVYNASFQLDPSQEVPLPGSPGDALGSCVAILDLEDSMLELSCTHNVSNANGAHIHFGDRGEAGPVVFPLGDAGSPILFETALTDEQIAAFITGNYYVNIHNGPNAAGIIRGQIEFDAQEDAASMTVGSLANTDNGSVCRVVLSQRTGDNDARVTCITEIENLTEVGIRPTAGGPFIHQFDDPNNLNQVFSMLSDAEADLLRDGGLSVVFNTMSSSTILPLDGCFADDNTLCLNNERFAVTVSGAAPDGNGGFNDFDGRAFPRTDTSGEFSFFTADNLEILIKVLDGCPVNNNYWVFFSALTNVEFTVTVTDTENDVTVTYDNPQGMVADPVTDVTAFATCP